MERVKGLNTDAELNKLRRLAEHARTLQGQLDSIADDRDALIRAATDKGASRRTLAEAAGVSVGRVQQILGEQ